MTPDEIDLFLARLRLDEALPAEVDAFVAWAFERHPAGPRLRQLAGYRPIGDDLARDFVEPAVAEAGLAMPTELDAMLALARHEMRRVVAGESGWYAEVVDDIRAEAEYHLGLRAAPPPDRFDAASRPAVPATPAVLAAPTVPAVDDAALAPALGGGDDHRAAEAYTLGLAYEYGNGVPRDLARAADWYRQGADLGHPTALNNLGCLYDRGSGVARDRATALELWRTAAERGNERAQCSIGYAYETGDGVPQDWQEAIAWYRRAAGNGCAAAHTNLGNLLLAGEVLPRDLAQAVTHYRRGAELGCARSQYQLGALHQRGEGVPRDFERAAELFRRAYDALHRQRQ